MSCRYFYCKLILFIYIFFQSLIFSISQSFASGFQDLVDEKISLEEVLKSGKTVSQLLKVHREELGQKEGKEKVNKNGKPLPSKAFQGLLKRLMAEEKRFFPVVHGNLKEEVVPDEVDSFVQSKSSEEMVATSEDLRFYYEIKMALKNQYEGDSASVAYRDVLEIIDDVQFLHGLTNESCGGITKSEVYDKSLREPPLKPMHRHTVHMHGNSNKGHALFISLQVSFNYFKERGQLDIFFDKLRSYGGCLENRLEKITIWIETQKD